MTAVATGVGSLPGIDPHEAAALVAGELPDYLHLAELPARGPGADMVGRAVGLLVDLHVDLQPSGWRLVDRPGRDERRAQSFLRHDLDDLQQVSEGYRGRLKTQVAGPWTLAAALRLTRGEPVLSDPGALRDVVASLVEGVAGHVADVRRRVPGAELVLQLDEPALPSVLEGRVRSFSGFRTFAPVPAAQASQVLGGLVDAVGVPVVVHCCAKQPPIGLLHRCGVAGVSVDLTLLPERLEEQLGGALEDGVTLYAGVVPSTDPASATVSDPATTVEPVRRLWHRLGLTPESMRATVVTPTCGLAGATPGWARTALRLAREGARQLAEDPERTPA